MSVFNNSHAGEQGAVNITTPSSSRNLSTQSAKRGRSGAGTYSGVTKDSRRVPNSPILQNIISAQVVDQPDLWETINSVVIPKEVKAGENGDNQKPRLKVRWQGMNMFGWVDGAWKPAAYHMAYREKLILRDAAQPDAPVWRKGMSLNYTSYSPLMRGWSFNPDTIQDSKGRLVCRMRRPPQDWSHNPPRGYLEVEGLVLLDHNNRPVKDFPGAPGTLDGAAPAWEIEGLRRSLGMTYLDIRARMPPVRNTSNGRMRLQTCTHFSNAVGKWIKDVNKLAKRKIIIPWHNREKGLKSIPTNEMSDDGPSQQAEDEAQEEELVPPTRSMAFNEVASHPINDPVPSSSTVHMPLMPEQTSWEGNLSHIPIFPGTNTVPSDSIYTATCPPTFAPQKIYTAAAGPSRPVGQALEPDYPSQLNAQQVDQPYIPTFPGANQFSPTTNTVPSDSVYYPVYPSTSAPPDIYDAAAYPSTITPRNIYTSAAYAPNLIPQNMYTDPNYPCHFGSPNMYSTPYKYNIRIPTAPGFRNIPTFTNSVGMSPPNVYAQPPPTYGGQHDDFRLHGASRPTIWGQNPPITAPQSPQTVATAPTASVLPTESAPMAFSSSEGDPFMGADWSSDAADEWL